VTPPTPADTNAGTGTPRGLTILLGTAAAVVTVAGIRATAWLAAPMLLALVIVIAISPVHRWLRFRGVRAGVATLALVLLVYGVLITFGVVVVVSLARLAALLPQYTERYRDLVLRATDLLDRFGIGPAQLRDAANSLDLHKALSWLGTLLTDLTGLTTSIVLLLALLMFLTVEAGGIGARLTEIATDRPDVSVALRGFAHRTRRYLVVTTIFGLVVAVLDTLALAWLGIPLAVLWGLLSFVTNYIPNLGFILGVLPPALLALLSAGVRVMLIVIVVYAAINFVGQSLIQPRYVGDAVGLSAATTFAALVFWTWVLGPLGMLLAMPATLLVTAVLVDTDPRAGWAAALLRTPARGKRVRTGGVRRTTRRR
jgi:AI-2 transport protein TqsA